MKRKFIIRYPKDHPEEEKRGQIFKPSSSKDMIVMNANGIFFVYNGEQYYPSITELRYHLPVYDVEWTDSSPPPSPESLIFANF